MTPTGLRNFRLVLWVLVAVAAIGATALYLFAPPRDPAAPSFGQGSYAVTDQNGAPLDQTMFQGHPSLVFFGYTHCPDVCPTTLAEMASWFESLGDEAKNLRGYFVTVDPERDTPAVLGQYVNWTDGKVTGVTGTPEEMDKMLKAWGVVAEKVPGSNAGDYTMNHTASVFLLNTSGGFEGTIAYGENAGVAMEKIKKLLAKA